MWKCSKCETENEGEHCKVCGSERTKQSYTIDQLYVATDNSAKGPVTSFQNGKPTSGSPQSTKTKSMADMLTIVLKKKIVRNKILVICSLVAILALMAVPYRSFYTGRLTSQGYEIWDLVSIFSLMSGYDVTSIEIIGSWAYFLLALLPTIFVFAKLRNSQKNTFVLVASFISAVFMTGFDVAIWVGNTTIVPLLSIFFISCSVTGTVRVVRLTKEAFDFMPN